ncbi:cell envelope biogenesis protein TolA [Methylocella silvestris]|uniref:Cell envelope biogenesis protein TolA n=1 Tax=Methylocella silvestris TaxID=199596 RepID=A0A2J7TJ53_METSI|nr:cell envelope biogenesis protein TolA [Methylocella silvestris]PNG26800.1 cell envelope biogenesis protein TolA [Methylocella silvestris]
MSLRDHPGAALSGGGHALLLAAMVFSFAHSSKFDDAQETIPVEMLTDSQFNQIMKGEKTAKLSEKPQQKAQKLAEIAEAKPVVTRDPAKTDVPTPPPRAQPVEDPGRSEEAKAAPTPPERPVDEPAKAQPEPQKAEPAKTEPAAKAEPAKQAAVTPPDAVAPDAEEPKPVAKPKPEPKKVAEAKPEPKKIVAEPKPRPVEPQKKPEPKFKPDELAKLLEEQKPKDKPQEMPAKPKSGEESAEPTPKFDLSAISRLLNKDAPQQKAATGRELQQVASLGSPTASASKMSPSLWAQLDGILQDQYRHCWNFVGLAGQQKYVPQIHVQYAQDGGLVGAPELLNPPADPNLRSLADSALRAVRRCNPLRIPAQYQPFYDQWKGRIVRFDPEDML